MQNARVGNGSRLSVPINSIWRLSALDKVISEIATAIGDVFNNSILWYRQNSRKYQGIWTVRASIVNSMDNFQINHLPPRLRR